ncbi:protein of unknown function [Hyphomicrobium sp. MC1]|nr:protein of unknown function [Hyphomicrobium sp. MC1]
MSRKRLAFDGRSSAARKGRALFRLFGFCLEQSESCCPQPLCFGESGKPRGFVILNSLRRFSLTTELQFGGYCASRFAIALWFHCINCCLVQPTLWIFPHLR